MIIAYVCFLYLLIDQIWLHKIIMAKIIMSNHTTILSNYINDDERDKD